MTFKIGDRIKLKDYTEYGDYRERKGEIAIIESKDSLGALDFNIRWEKESPAYRHETSSVNLSNMIPVEINDWKSRIEALSD